MLVTDGEREKALIDLAPVAVRLALMFGVKYNERSDEPQMAIQAHGIAMGLSALEAAGYGTP